MENKRVVFFCGTLMQGGAERVISVLSRYFAEKGIDTMVLCYYDAEVFYDMHPDVKIVCVEQQTGSRNLLKNLLWLRKFFRANADVILSFLASFNMYALVAHIGLRMPIIVADRSDPNIVPHNILVRKVRDFIYRFADHVVVQTQRNYDYFPRAVQHKSSVIFNPVDMGEYKASAINTQKQKRIVSVGRLIKSKNHKLLIDAFAQIAPLHPDYTLTIYGDGDHARLLATQVASLGLEEKVLLPGKEKKVFEKIADAELFVLSSDYEGMPNALIEAMCLGLPVISTDVSGAADFIQNGKNGMLVDCNDLPQLVSAMEKMLQDDILRRTCAEEACFVATKVEAVKIFEEWKALI